MHKLPLLFVVAALASLPAQGNMRDVVPGREVRDSKLLTPGQTDTWAIDVKADEVLRCRVTSQQLDPVLELVDAAGTILRRDDGKGSQSYVEYRASEPGKLAFRVSGYRGGGGGRYEFWLERYIATKAVVGQEVAGKFGEERWAHVRLELEKGERVVAVASGGTLRHMVRFGDEQQSALPSHMSTYTATASGEYHLPRARGEAVVAPTQSLAQGWVLARPVLVARRHRGRTVAAQSVRCGGLLFVRCAHRRDGAGGARASR